MSKHIQETSLFSSQLLYIQCDFGVERKGSFSKRATAITRILIFWSKIQITSEEIK